jgi:hypothetical protein
VSATATTAETVSAHAATAEHAPGGVTGPLRPRPAPEYEGVARLTRFGGFASLLTTLGVAAGLCALVFYAKGGWNPTNPRPMTVLEMTLTLAGGAAVAGVVLFAAPGRPFYGGWAVGLLLALTALTALSVVWSVQPDESW